MSESELSQQPSRPPRKRRVRRVFICVVLAGAGLLVAGYFYAEYRANKRLQAALHTAAVSDPDWRLEDLEAHREKIPDDKNSAVVVTTAATLVPNGWGNLPNFGERNPHSARQLSEKQVGILREKIKQISPALARARALKDLPRGHYAVQWSEDAISTLLPHIQEVREVAGALGWEARLRAHDKDMTAALDLCRATLNAGRSIGDEPTYISALVRVAIRAIATARLEEVLSQGEASEAALAAAQKAWQEEEQFPLLLAAARGERAFGDRAVVSLQSGKGSSVAAGITAPSRNATVDKIFNWFRMGSLTNNRAALLEFHNEFIDIARLPEQQRKARWQEFHENTLTLPLLARLMVPAADKMVEADKRSRAVLRTMIAGLAAERYRLANGDFPASLQVLTPRFLKEVPIDPYDGAALRFRRLPDGIVIYSVGADEKDNAGLLGNGATPGTDIGVRLWQPKHRRQPPATGNEEKPGG